MASEVARYAVQDLRAAYEAFCAGREEATRLESRLRVEAVVAGGYRVGTVSDDELAAAVKAAAVSPRLRVDAARALRRIDLPRAALVVEEAASATADGTLANELREIVASRDDADVDITQTLP